MKIRSLLPLGLALAFLVAIPYAGRAEDAPAAPATAEESEGVPAGWSYDFDGTASWHAVDNPYFSTDVAHWREAFVRGRVHYGLPAGAYLTVGGVGAVTMDTDYYGVGDEYDGLLDQLLVGLPHVGGSDLSLTIGRQNMTLGDGFLVGDGYRDHFAALWNIPLSFYDGVLANWARGPHHVTAFAADVSPSFTAVLSDLSGDREVAPDGILAGGEIGWSPGEGKELALALVKRTDDSEIAYEPMAMSLRGAWTRGVWGVAGEAVLESGQWGDTDLAGKGGHLRVTWAGEGKYEPALKAEYFYYSGDDPDTDDKLEAYDPLQYSWSDWSNYYVGDLLASTVGTASNMRIMMLQAAFTPREGTGVRLLAHRFDRAKADTEPFAYEFDAVIDQKFGEHWSGWLMGAYASPLDAAKLEFGDNTSTQVFLALTYKIGGKLSQ